ncbi:MAG TPA: GNAT family N-acetyltransferase [Trueperaceae bacterium]
MTKASQARATLKLRSMIDADDAAFVAFYNLCRPESPTSLEDLRFVDRAYGQCDVLHRHVLERDGQLVGASLYATEHTGIGQYRMDLVVDPRENLEPLGDRLYHCVMQCLKPLNANALIVRIREDWSEWLRFYHERGFAELERMWESRLDVGAFDPTSFVWAPARAAAEGITFKTLAELPDDERTRRRLYETVVELLHDVPQREPHNIWPFEVWQERYWNHPNRSPESHFLAFARDELAGVSELRKSKEPGRLDTGLTGVRRPWRRQGIALSLKLLAVAYAKRQGARIITTQNHTINRPMLSINEAMGFVKQPAWIRLKRLLGEGFLA